LKALSVSFVEGNIGIACLSERNHLRGVVDANWRCTVNSRARAAT
jgi:hypothetical protein